MELHDTSNINTLLKVSQVSSPNKECGIITLKSLVNDSCLQKILAAPIPLNPFLTLFARASLEVENSPLNQPFRPLTVWMFKNLINHRNLIGYGN